MKVACSKGRDVSGRETAATAVEVLISVGLLGIVFVSLFSGMTMGTAETRAAREELRATQIMLERMEGIRLYNWDQLVYSNNLCPPTFTASYYPVTNSSGSTGITYYGTMSVTNISISPAPSYSNQLRLIVVSVYWTNAGVRHSRTMKTQQAQYGEQNYTFNN